MPNLPPHLDTFGIIAEINAGNAGGGGGAAAAYAQALTNNLNLTSEDGTQTLAFDTVQTFGPKTATLVDGELTFPAPDDPAAEVDVWNVRLVHQVTAAEPTTGFVIVNWGNGDTTTVACGSGGFFCKRTMADTYAVIATDTPVIIRFSRVTDPDNTGVPHDYRLQAAAVFIGTLSI